MMIEWKENMSAFDFVKAKYEAKECVTEKEAFNEELVYLSTVDQSEGSGRWTEHILCVYSQGDEHYGIKYERGLTESQENYFSDQVPVKLQVKEVTIRKYEICNDFAVKLDAKEINTTKYEEDNH